MHITPLDKKSLQADRYNEMTFIFVPFYSRLKRMELNRWSRTLPGVLLILFLFNAASLAQVSGHWETLIIPGRQCQYLVPASPVDPAWTSSAFDDSGWTTGTGGVGYGDDDDNTIIDPAIWEESTVMPGMP